MHFLTLTNTFSAHMQLELGRRVEDKYEQIHLFQLTREWNAWMGQSRNWRRHLN